MLEDLSLRVDETDTKFQAASKRLRAFIRANEGKSSARIFHYGGAVNVYPCFSCARNNDVTESKSTYCVWFLIVVLVILLLLVILT